MNLLEMSVWVFAMLFLWLFVERRCNQLESIFDEWRHEKNKRLDEVVATVYERESEIKRLKRELGIQNDRFRSKLYDILDDKEDDE